MADPKGNELREIYKLHAELADRVSQKREGANRLYASLLAGLVALLAILLRLGLGHEEIVFYTAGAIGILLSASWYVVIRSCRQLNAGKFEALQELEKKRPYPFFRREWELLDEGKNRSRYWKLTFVETGLPLIFFGSVRILQAHVLHLVSACVDHGERNNGSGAVSGLGFQHR